MIICLAIIVIVISINTNAHTKIIIHNSCIYFPNTFSSPSVIFPHPFFHSTFSNLQTPFSIPQTMLHFIIIYILPHPLLNHHYFTMTTTLPPSLLYLHHYSIITTTLPSSRHPQRRWELRGPLQKQRAYLPPRRGAVGAARYLPGESEFPGFPTLQA